MHWLRSCEQIVDCGISFDHPGKVSSFPSSIKKSHTWRVKILVPNIVKMSVLNSKRCRIVVSHNKTKPSFIQIVLLKYVTSFVNIQRLLCGHQHTAVAYWWCSRLPDMLPAVALQNWREGSYTHRTYYTLHLTCLAVDLVAWYNRPLTKPPDEWLKVKTQKSANIT